MKPIKTGLAILAIAAASAGAAMLYGARFDLPILEAGKPETPASEAEASPIFVSLEPFTVTLGTTQTRRILHVAITLRVADQGSGRQIHTYMPEVRNRVLSVLAVQDPLAIQTQEGRAALVHALARELRAPYAPMPRGPDISNVLFTAFVIQ